MGQKKLSGQFKKQNFLGVHYEKPCMCQKFQCPDCDYDNHQKSIHKGQKFPCAECEYQATTKVTFLIIRSTECDHQAEQKGDLALLDRMCLIV